MIRLEHFYAIGTTAKVHILPGDLMRDGPPPWFFRQAGCTYDQIICFPDEFPWFSHEQVGAGLATETKFLIVPAGRGRLILVDSQPNEGTATGRTNEGFHLNGLREFNGEELI